MIKGRTTQSLGRLYARMAYAARATNRRISGVTSEEEQRYARIPFDSVLPSFAM